MADVLPTIDEILAGVADRRVSAQDAKGLIEQHLGSAVAAAADRDEFAGLAMQALLGDRAFLQDARNKGADEYRCVAEASYRQADEMKIARTK